MSVGSDELVVALYDYTAKDPEELSIRKNEQLVLLDAKFTWWKVRNGNSKVGLVPSNYLRRDKGKGESLVNRIANKLPGGKKGKFGGAGGAGMVAGGGGGSRGDSPSANPGAGHQSVGGGNRNQLNEEYVSKFNYEATKGDELTLTKGMRVLVLEMEGDGWWYGKDADRPGNPGWFPSNYVAKEAQNASSGVTIGNASPPKQVGSSDCIMVVRTLYTFNSGNHEELAFEQDEMLDIIEQPADDPEWWLARNSDGTTGLVPKNYVETVHDAQPVSNQTAHPVQYDNPIESHNGTGDVNTQSNNPPQHEDNHDPGKEWFFGSIRRVDAEKLLSDRAKNGQFLVRNCETSAGEFSISMKMPGRMRHFKVTVLPSGQYGIGQRQFESMEALLDHYKRAPIYTSAEQGKVYLTNPMPR